MPDGLDLKALCLGEVDAGHEHAVCCYRNSSLSREPNRTPYFDPPIHGTMIRDDRYKLALFHDCEDHTERGEGELFDLEEDPLEQRNLWDDSAHTAIKECLMDSLVSWLYKHPSRIRTPS